LKSRYSFQSHSYQSIKLKLNQDAVQIGELTLILLLAQISTLVIGPINEFFGQQNFQKEL